ncbi:uncharacterized protein LOC134770815 [Penaeus indicus]|uniref:uncharacterized protein LOC134770815 n=1 Tax=Penaeus indicus TaxID=29960 RepID=UPI00300D0900
MKNDTSIRNIKSCTEDTSFNEEENNAVNSGTFLTEACRRGAGREASPPSAERFPRRRNNTGRGRFHKRPRTSLSSAKRKARSRAEKLSCKKMEGSAAVTQMGSEDAEGKGFSAHTIFSTYRPPLFRRPPKKLSLLQLQRKREIQDVTWQSFTRQNQMTKSLVYRLGITKQLEGHRGCVNCIEFNTEGR